MAKPAGQWDMLPVVTNAVLVAAAFILPKALTRRQDGMAGAATAAILFLLPMMVALIVGIAAAIGSFNRARRTGIAKPGTGWLPLGIFLIGVILFAALAVMRLR
ncbi:MAG: hypothetical protein SFV51_18510 [Bryobacteraceae bacterium]|nr:hypothetical protein [Bryobacteraceae bacterium]